MSDVDEESVGSLSQAAADGSYSVGGNSVPKEVEGKISEKDHDGNSETPPKKPQSLIDILTTESACVSVLESALDCLLDEETQEGIKGMLSQCNSVIDVAVNVVPKVKSRIENAITLALNKGLLKSSSKKSGKSSKKSDGKADDDDDDGEDVMPVKNVDDLLEENNEDDEDEEEEDDDGDERKKGGKKSQMKKVDYSAEYNEMKVKLEDLLVTSQGYCAGNPLSPLRGMLNLLEKNLVPYNSALAVKAGVRFQVNS